jgi:secondary thiamine-phosphate synthase enzyme
VVRIVIQEAFKMNMQWYKRTIEIRTSGKGLYPFSETVQSCIRGWGVKEGMCFLFIPHTSASILLNENYDPSVQADITEFLERLIPENQGWIRHTMEGADDSSSHLRSALLPSSISIPIADGILVLGTWQGIFLAEHRTRGHHRKVEIRVLDVE